MPAPIVADRYGSHAEIVRCVAARVGNGSHGICLPKVCQGAPKRSFYAEHQRTALGGPVQRERAFDPASSANG